LTVFDAAMAYGLTNDDVFPKRGADITYTLNGKKKFIRGTAGEACQISLNGSEVGMNHLIQSGDNIEIKVSTRGEDAKALLENIVDLSDSIKFNVNDKIVECPRYASVNGKLELGSYEINDGDNIDILGYYTLTQLMQFMDIETPHEVFVNGARAGADTKIYENFNVAWIDREDIYIAEKFVTEEIDEEEPGEDKKEESEAAALNKNEKATVEDNQVVESVVKTQDDVQVNNNEKKKPKKEKKKNTVKDDKPHDIHLMVNDTPITLSGKSSYVFIDIFDKYDFDLKNVGGTKLIQQVDGAQANYLGPIYEGSKIDLYWEQ